MKSLSALVLLSALALPATSFAEPHVFLNNVDITYVRNQTFQNADVSIDAAGNIMIVAPQYKITERAFAGTAPAAQTYVAPAGTKLPSQDEIDALSSTLESPTFPTYLLVSFSHPGLLGLNVDIFINDRFVKTLNQDDVRDLIDVSAYLVKGKNMVRYRLTSAASAGRSSKATVELSFAQLKGVNGSQLDMTAPIGKKVIGNTNKLEDVTLAVYKP